MRTQMFRVWALGVTVASLAFGTGCQQREARAAEPTFTDLAPEVAANTPAADAPQVEAPAPLPDAVGAPGLEKSTNAAPPKMVQAPVLPENLKVSPALEEILKLAQAGVSEDVLLSYVTNSTHLFSANSDAIVYLHDLGVSDSVITALIAHDATPEMQAQKLASTAVRPLPPGAALTTPATNVYPPSVAETAPPAEPTPAPQVETVVQTNYVVQQVEQPASVTYFYSSLAPYGSWVEVDGYGLCWQPTVAVHNSYWRPYADNGRWIWSDCGWYWYSDYSWGWAPFHYGRWCSYPRLGWLWVPDTHWGPSWVSWRYSSSYCGWAPLPPGCHYGSGGLWYGGVSVGVGFSFGFGWSDYCYVPLNRFCDRNPGLHFARGDHARRIHGNTTVVNNYINGNNNTIINRGIGRERVATATRGQVPTATVREASVRANGRREQLVNNGSTMAIMRPGLPEQPARSHVNIPTRRVSATTDGTAGAVPNRGFGATTRGNAVDSSSAIRPNSPAIAGRRGLSRNDTAERAPSARAETPQPTRPGFATDRRSRSEGATTPGNRGSESTPIRPNAPAVRSFSGSRDNGNSGVVQSRSEPTVIARNDTPATPAVSSPRTQVRTPVTSTPAPTAPTRSPVVPNSTARRGEAFRSYGNPSPAVRNTPLPQTPAARSTPAPSAPASRPGLSPSSSISRPEPSRSVPSYSAPARPAPSYSQPARPAPSYSAPVRSAPSYSAPSSPARSAPSYSAPAARSSSPSASSSGGGRGGYSSSGGGGGGRGGYGGRNR